MAVRHIDNRKAAQVEAAFAGQAADARLGPDQDGLDQAQPVGVQRAFERLAAARMDHAHLDAGQALGGVEQLVVAQVPVGHQRLGQVGAQNAQAVGRRNHMGLAVNHHIAVLIDAARVQPHLAVGGLQRADRDGHGQGVADVHRLEELERLAQVNRSRAGKLRAQHGRDQGAAQHAVGDDFVEVAGLGIQRIDMRRVHVARDGGKQLDVALRDLAHQAGAVAHANPGEGMVFKKIGRRAGLGAERIHG